MVMSTFTTTLLKSKVGSIIKWTLATVTNVLFVVLLVNSLTNGN